LGGGGLAAASSKDDSDKAAQTKKDDGKMSVRSMVRWFGLIAGPILAWCCFQQLPSEFQDAGGTLVEFTFAGRVTLSIMVWMAAV
jgi:hypothetical protein